jgi:hypothetical protein
MATISNIWREFINYTFTSAERSSIDNNILFLSLLIKITSFLYIILIYKNNKFL